MLVRNIFVRRHVRLDVHVPGDFPAHTALSLAFESEHQLKKGDEADVFFFKDGDHAAVIRHGVIVTDGPYFTIRFCDGEVL